MGHRRHAVTAARACPDAGAGIPWGAVRARLTLILLLAAVGLGAGTLVGTAAPAQSGIVCPQPLGGDGAASADAVRTLTATLPCSPCPPIHTLNRVCPGPCDPAACPTPTVTTPVPAATCSIAASLRVRHAAFRVHCDGPSRGSYRAWAGRSGRRLGRGHAKATAAGKASVRVKLSRRGRHLVAAAAHGLRVRVIVHDASGHTVMGRVVRLRD